MKRIIYFVLLTLTFVLANCASQPNEKVNEKVEKQEEINDVDTIISKAFKEKGVCFTDLVKVGVWTFHIPKDPKIPASEDIRFVASLYKLPQNGNFYLYEHDLKNQGDALRSVYIKKNKNEYLVADKENPSISYRIDKEGNCWEHEDGVEDTEGFGSFNKELMD